MSNNLSVSEAENIAGPNRGVTRSYNCKYCLWAYENELSNWLKVKIPLTIQTFHITIFNNPY